MAWQSHFWVNIQKARKQNSEEYSHTHEQAAGHSQELEATQMSTDG